MNLAPNIVKTAVSQKHPEAFGACHLSNSQWIKKRCAVMVDSDINLNRLLVNSLSQN